MPDKWVGYGQQGYDFLPLATETLSAEDILRFRDYAFNAYFTHTRYLNMIERKFGRAAAEHIRAMTAVRLKRKLLGD